LTLDPANLTQESGESVVESEAGSDDEEELDSDEEEGLDWDELEARAARRVVPPPQP
jgi:nucleosome binding factor SPN SPT16 subunit